MFAATHHFWRLFLHPKPEDMPYCSDRYPLITDLTHKLWELRTTEFDVIVSGKDIRTSKEVVMTFLKVQS
jgi:hypothetical protein